MVVGEHVGRGVIRPVAVLQFGLRRQRKHWHVQSAEAMRGEVAGGHERVTRKLSLLPAGLTPKWSSGVRFASRARQLWLGLLFALQQGRLGGLPPA